MKWPAEAISNRIHLEGELHVRTGNKATEKAKAIGATTGTALAIIGLTAMALPATAAVEEIIVTAQRREQNIQDVPVAVSAFSAGQITSRQIDTVQDIGQNVPNLQTTRWACTWMMSITGASPA
ncbi:MAG: TonB-dependent receptor [Gammaproteobacteria bacterium PRO9]|nr:TonB-dependent receptor [Gammaproteobacteria bacterium PRO9]